MRWGGGEALLRTWVAGQAVGGLGTDQVAGKCVRRDEKRGTKRDLPCPVRGRGGRGEPASELLAGATRTQCEVVREEDATLAHRLDSTPARTVTSRKA